MKKKEIYGALLLSGFMLWPLWAHSTTYPETEQTSVVQQETGKITLNLKNASMKELLDEIHSQTGLDFMYSNEQFADMKEITLKVKNESVEKVLKQVFGNNGYDYQIKGKIVTLRKRKLNANQAYEVQGTVYDAEGIPVIGATVMVKGTHTGVVTDVNGHYQINVKPNQTLSYSYLGMEPKDLKYTGSKFLDVILTYDKKTVLDNVVVTGIFRKSKESYTGAVSTVTKEQLEINTGQNLLQTLKNMDASINFSIDNLNGSNPNNIPNINIRGNSSLPMSVEEYNESNQNNPNTPLVILDGFEISITKLMDYNDEEIESINILKDAAATAIYGSRGANGVIVVVTKRPEAGKLKVSAEVGLIMEIPDLSSYNMLNAAEKLEVEKRVGLYDENYSISGNNEYKLKEAYNNRLKTVLSGTDTDWLSKPLHTGVGSKYNLRLEGGSDQFRWATSLQYKNTEGAMKGSSRKTFNGSITLMYQLQNLIFRNYTSVDINHGQESKYGSFSDYVTQQPYNAPYDAEGNLVRYFDPFMSNYSKPQNPLYDASLNSFDKTAYTTLTNNFSIEWNILKELTLRGQFGISSDNNTSDYFLPAEHSYFTVDNQSTYEGDEGFLRRGLYRYGNNKSWSYNANVTLAYNKIFKDVHSLYVGLDWSIRESRTDGFNIALEGFTNDNMANIGNALQYAENEMPYGSNFKNRQFGITANVNYTYDNRYYIDLSYRMDGSSAYGSDKKYAPFWSAGLGWNLHQEKFLKANPVINMLRLKASHGETGAASGASTTDAYTLYNYVTNNKYMNWIGAQLAGWGNPNLTWQTTKEFNVGMEFGLWDNRLRGSFDWYQKNTSNLLSNMDIPQSMGFSSYSANVGEVRNTGWEAMLSAYIIRNHKREFNWMISGQLVYNKNEITKLSDAIKKQTETYMNSTETGSDIQKLFYEGNPQNAIYAVKSLGIDPSTGREIYLDKNGNITDEWKASNKVCLGSADPLYRGNASTMLQYKGWTLNVSFSYYWGGKVYNQTLRDRVEVTANTLMNSNVDERVLTSRWYKAGDVTFFKAMSNNTSYSTSRYVMDDNVLELSSVSLQYKLKSKWLQKIANLNTVIFSVNANDLFHWSAVKMERGTSYPYSRNVQGSVKLLF